jgi:hypothetical protein
MKRKILATLLSLTMVLGMTCTAFAAELNSTSRSGDTKVQYTVEESYTVTIPGDISLTSSKTSDTGIVSAENVLINKDNSLTVTMSSTTYSNGYKLTAPSGNSSIPYTIKTATNSSNALEDKAVVLKVTSGSTSGNETLTFAVDADTVANNAKESGNYTDTLTFTVAVGTTSE